MENALHSGKTDAILMASGFSRRFGSENKLLTLFRGKPLCIHTLDLVCGMKDFFNGIFFIAADEQVAALAAGLPVTLIRNDAPGKGQRESVRLGVQAACADFYFFFPCDQPLLGWATVLNMLTARRPGKIVAPYCRNCADKVHASGPAHSDSQVRNGSPNLFSADFREELLTLAKGEHPRTIKERHPDAVILVEAPVCTLLDIDNPNDLIKLI